MNQKSGQKVAPKIDYKHLCSRIVGRLHCIDLETMTTAERQIVNLLVGAGLMRRDPDGCAYEVE